MASNPIRPSKATLLNINDTTYNLRNKIDAGTLFMFLIFSFFSLGIPLLLLLIYHSLKYAFKANQIRVLRHLDAAACCYEWSLRNAIKCRVPEGLVYILEKTLTELRETAIPLTGPYKYNSRGRIMGIPDIARLEAALTLAAETRDRSDEIRRLAGETGLIQSMEVIRNMLRGEDIWFGWEGISINARDVWFWFDWTEADQRKYNASQCQQIPRDISTQTTTDPRAPVPSKSAQFSVLSLEAFTGSHLISFDEYQRMVPSLQYLSEDSQWSSYKAYQQSEYQRYLDRVSPAKPALIEMQNDQPTPPQRNDDIDTW